MENGDEQLGFELGEEPVAVGYTPNLQHVREDLNTILEEARSGTHSAPWDTRTLRYKRIVFLQMTKWLPEDEAEQLCFAFIQEIERIEQLLAA